MCCIELLLFVGYESFCEHDDWQGEDKDSLFGQSKRGKDLHYRSVYQRPL